jgi:hypothetical protein
VVPLVAAGLGIVIAIMAFAPAASGPPPSVAVGVHEANYDVEGEASELTWYFKVHTGVKLFDQDEFDSVATWITGGKYDVLVDSLLDNHGHQILDQRAVDILEAIRLLEDSLDRPFLDFTMGTEWNGKSGYWFHVFMRFEIEPPARHKQFIRLVRSGNLRAINGILTGWINANLIRGNRPAAIVAAVRQRGPDRDLPHR